MNTVFLAYRYIVYKPMQSVLHIILFGLGVALIVLMLQFNDQIVKSAQRNIMGTDLVIGAKGSPMQIILCNIFHTDFPTGNIRLKEAEHLIKHPQIEEALPLALGDSYNGFRIVGTTEKVVSWYRLSVQRGYFPKEDNEVAVGASVAKALSLDVGYTFMSSHGFSAGDSSDHHHFVFKVAAVLDPSNTVADDLIYSTIPAVWQVHAHHAEEEENVIPALHFDLLPGVLVENSDEKEITSLLIKYKSPRGALQIPRYVNEKTNMQAASPAFELARLQNLMGSGQKTLQYLAVFILIIAGMSIAFNLFNAMNQRKYDMAIMYSHGAATIQLFLMLLYEGVMIAVSGFFMGLLMTHVILYVIAEHVTSLNMLNPFKFLTEEGIVLMLSVVFGALCALLPALSIRDKNTAQILAKG